MSNYIPNEIIIDRKEPNKIIISNSKKELVISDYLAILAIALTYLLCIFLQFYFFSSEFDWFYFIIIFLMFSFNTRLLLSFIISIKETQFIIITNDSVEIIKKRPFLSRYLKLERSQINKIDLEVYGFFAFLLPSAIVGFKHELNFKYYKVPRISTKNFDYYIFEHFRSEVREWIIGYLNKVIK